MRSKETVSLYERQYDITNCDAEPLRQIRRIQSYGALIIANSDLTKWYYASANIIDQLEAISLPKYLDSFLISKERQSLRSDKVWKPRKFVINGVEQYLIKHVEGDLIYLEFEKNLDSVSTDLIEDLQSSILSISKSSNLEDFLDQILLEVQRLTSYEHIMIYQFDEEFNGTVLKEIRTKDRPIFQGLKFPASDIPEQARALYFEESIRTISDVSSEQVPLLHNNSVSHLPDINLSRVHVRGVSPIHLEYLSNMGVKASFSVAIIQENRLWGLIACHHTQPSIINIEKRKWLKFLSSFISTNLNNLSRETQSKIALTKFAQRKELLYKLFQSNDLIQSLIGHTPNLLSLIDADSVYLRTENKISHKGKEIESSKIDAIISWLDQKGNFDVISSSKSKDELPQEIYDEKIAGYLAIQLSVKTKDYIIFFRPSQVTKVNWAGNPSINKEIDEDKGRLVPRKSFKKWVSITEHQSEPWNKVDLEIAQLIKEEIRDLLYKKYVELSELNEKLEKAYKSMESFSYTVSHDLKSPLRAIRGFAQILKENYENQIDDYGLKLLGMIDDAISNMNHFIEDILSISKLNSDKLRIKEVDLNHLIDKSWKSFASVHPKASLEVVRKLPIVYGDELMLKQLFTNLMSNSVKYVKAGEDPSIKIDHQIKGKFVEIYFSDNGIGIPQNHRDKVFNLFRRLVSDNEYEGSGVGLAIVKSVIEKHNCHIEIEDNPHGGTIFKFTLPTEKSHFKSK